MRANLIPIIARRNGLFLRPTRAQLRQRRANWRILTTLLVKSVTKVVTKVMEVVTSATKVVKSVTKVVTKVMELVTSATKVVKSVTKVVTKVMEVVKSVAEVPLSKAEKPLKTLDLAKNTLKQADFRATAANARPCDPRSMTGWMAFSPSWAWPPPIVSPAAPTT